MRLINVSTLVFICSTFSLVSGSAFSDHLNPDCEGSGLFDSDTALEYIRHASDPKVLNDGTKLYLTLYDIFVGEPVGAPSYVAIVVESHDGRDCYLLEDAASSSGGRGDGFGGTMADHSFAFWNEQKNHTQLFVPVHDYVYATDTETYAPRFVEIVITGDDDLSLSIAK